MNFNTAALLRNCLHSLQTSRHQLHVAVIVVDNASVDGSVAMVHAEFPEVELIAHTTNVGYSAGNNAGLRRLGFGQFPARPAVALPRYVLLLNPDTVVAPTTLADMVRFMDDHPAIGVAGPRAPTTAA
ncbi:MAG: glycosyltransferase [Anaerolineales bacterium]|nr:glycosyltransferase [Anaerolineales bacterium]